MADFEKNLELINVQQAGKRELKKALAQQAIITALKAAYLAKKKGKKKITTEELEVVLK